METSHATLTATWARRIGATRADLIHIADAWPDLYQLRMPGKARRRRQRPLTATARAAADDLARVERAERDPDLTLGTTPAPMDVGVLDTLADLLASATELADRLAMTAGEADAEPPSSAYDFEALPRILLAASAYLPGAAEVDPECLDDAQDTARTMRRRLDAALGDLEDGHVLSTVCAWCRGATTTAPAGGELTLTVRLVVGEPVIVCASDVCEPPAEDCGTWVLGRPGWPECEWHWLAQRLGAA